MLLRGGGEDVLARRRLFFRRHSQGTPWYDLLPKNSRRERGCCTDRHSLMFTIYRLGCGCRQPLRPRRIAFGTLARRDHAMHVR